MQNQLVHPEFFDYSNKSFTLMYDLWFFGNPGQGCTVPLRKGLQGRTRLPKDKTKLSKVRKLFKAVEDLMNDQEKELILKRKIESQNIKSNILNRFISKYVEGAKDFTNKQVLQFLNQSVFTVFNKHIKR
jgi:translation initiation factor 2 beta subunit (eIF-2beta)/eIF-5